MTARKLCRIVAAGFASLIASSPAFAQSDPFQSNPGPAVPAAPRPRPARPAPEPEAPAVVLPPRTNFDGVWAGTYQCAAYQTAEAFSFNVVIEVKDGRITQRINGASGAPGTPGYEVWAGDISADGRVSISRSGISVGGGERYERQGRPPAGAAFRARIDGQFSGDTFAGNAVSTLPRDCRLSLIRHR
jgi:hypothetical protein